MRKTYHLRLIIKILIFPGTELKSHKSPQWFWRMEIATRGAVSVLNKRGPSETDWNPYFLEVSTSLDEKPPSGPIRIAADLSWLICSKSLIRIDRSSSQKISLRSDSWLAKQKSLTDVDPAPISGILLLPHCLDASLAILRQRSIFFYSIFFR